jgi:hypothetical protein
MGYFRIPSHAFPGQAHGQAEGDTMPGITPMSPGLSVAHYRITAKLGEGGMGEVWRATDTKLDREVAIKILPEALAADPDRMARFEREAKVLASLNHPNIAAIHGVEERALVMELVEGETLKGPLPAKDALAIAIQIAEALEYAHEKGVIHRDLKPANVKVTPEGRVKVLDFGLAAVTQGASSAGDPTNSPTLTISPTRAGMILGTAAYMSPEQAAGKPVDKRADIWSFGVVLYEMLTGRQLFHGETVSHTLADVLRAPIDFAPLPKTTPSAVRNLIARCLERDPKKRLRDIGEARILLENPFAPTPEPQAAPGRASLLPWIAAAALLAATSTLAFLLPRDTPRGPARPLLYSSAEPDCLQLLRPLVLCGHRGAFARRPPHDVQCQNGRRQIPALAPLPRRPHRPTAARHRRRLPSLLAPDSRFIGFFAGGKLKKIDTAGGPPAIICDAPSGRGGTWNADGVIVFNPAAMGSGFDRVSAAGGAPVPLNLDVDGRWPWFLPDGRHFLYSANAVAIRLGSLDSRQTTLLVESRANAIYAQGYVLYLRENSLIAQPFDLKRLAFSGEAVPLAEKVNNIGANRLGVFSVSQNGVLAYQSVTPGGAYQLTWLDRSGKKIGTLGEPADITGVSLSPNGKRAVASVLDPATGTCDLWIYDVVRGLKTRFTFDKTARLAIPAVWSPDGASIAFAAKRKDKYGIYRKAADLSGGGELLHAEDSSIYPSDWSPDGRMILYTQSGMGMAGGSFALPVQGEHKPIPVQARFGRLSRDGRWLVYAIFESGRFEVSAVPFSSPGGRVQISPNGGYEPRWRSDGREIFCLSPDGRLTGVEVRINGASLEVGRTQPLFGGLPTPQGGAGELYDVAAGGQAFLVLLPTAQPAAETLTLVQNWTAVLKK